MPVDWKAADSFHRLLAATVASMDGQMKLNYKRIADFYGEGATYDAIEGRFRIIKKQAAKLRDEVENGRPVAPARGSGLSSNDNTPKKPRTPKNQNSQDVVMTGRVTKSNISTPTKKRKPVHIKAENLESSASASTSSSYTDIDTPSSSVDNGGVIEDSFSYDPTLASFDLDLAASGFTGTVDPGLNLLMHENFWEDENVV